MKIRLFSNCIARLRWILVLLGLVSFVPSCGPRSNTADIASNDRAFAVAVQSDGRIVVAGDSYKTHWSVALIRYNSNGSLDTSFGTGGKVLVNVSGGARTVAVQNDGKIVAAGYNYDTYELVLIRCNSNGSLDTGFGAGGIVQTAVSQTGGGALAVVIQGDGKIVAAGYSYNGIGYDFALVRYSSNGTLDATFGPGGIVITTTGGVASGVAIQSGGKIIAAGGSYLVRYNSDGNLDSSFGTNGKVYTGSYYEQTSGIAIQADGRIVAAGSSYNGVSGYDLALRRYNDTGSPDISFAGSGRAVISASSLYALAPATVVLDPVSGKITAAGYSQFQSVFARCNSDGAPDASFASGGKIITTGYDYWGGSSSSIRAIAVQTDGKIIVAGETYKDDASGFDFALARNNSDGSIDTSFGSGGTVTAGM